MTTSPLNHPCGCSGVGPALSAPHVAPPKNALTPVVIHAANQPLSPAAEKTPEPTSARIPCWYCTGKHVGSAGIILEMSAGASTTIGALIARAQILEGEARQGYPWHRALAVGCLSVAAETMALIGRTDAAAKIKTAQKRLEVGDTWISPEITSQDTEQCILTTRDAAAANLQEAAAECPDAALSALLSSSATILLRSPVYSPPLEAWLKQINSALHPVVT